MDHYAITLEIDSLDDQQRSPSVWKFNNRLLDDALFVERLRKNFPKWLDEINFCDDLRITWDWMKNKIREESLLYGKVKANERRNRIVTTIVMTKYHAMVKIPVFLYFCKT